MPSHIIDRLAGPTRPWGRPASAVAGALNAIYRTARPLQGLFNGTWLGHPLHPLVTDVAVGAWTVVLVFDLAGIVFPGAGLGSAAALALWIGVLAGLVALASGATDWKDTYGPAQRIGFLHGLLMLVVVVLYVVSGALRVAGPIDGLAARLVAIVGFVGLAAGGFLGGELAFGFGSMVDHNAFRDGLPRFVRVALLDDLAQGLNYVEAAGQPVLLVRDGDALAAIGDVCSHAGGPLHEGTIEGGVVTCPWHGSRFRVADGTTVRSPATFPQPAYEVRVMEGQVEVRGGRR